MAAHHLHDDHAVVRLGGGVQAVDRVGGDLHRGLKAEGQVGAAEVVVDRLGHPDHGDALFVQAQRDAERVLAADRHERVHVARAQRRGDLRRAVDAVREGVRARGAEDRAAARQDPGGGLERQLDRVVFEHARPAVAKAQERVASRRRAAAHDGTDDRVEPGAVAASGEQPEAHYRPWPGRNSFVKGGSPEGGWASSRCANIQRAKAAQAAGSCQP